MTPHDLDAAVRAAARNNDLLLVKQLVAAGANVNAKDSNQESAYLLASSENAPEVLEWVLANGAQLGDKDRFNGTALIRAAERGQARSVGLLVQHKIDLNHVNNLGWQAIHESIWLGSDRDGHVDTLLVLIASGAELDRPSGNEKLAPLEMARRKEHPRQLKALEAALAGFTDNPDESLLRAASGGDAILAARALRAGANLEARDAQSRTPLLLAASRDHLEVARLLVHLGADPNAVDDRKDTAWLVTGVTGSVEMGKVLLWVHPDVTLRNRYGGVSVIPASERGHLDYVRWVTANTKINVNHVNDLGWTALLEAVILGDGSQTYVEVVRALLAAGADPKIADKDGVTALQHAQRKGQKAVAAVLGG